MTHRNQCVKAKFQYGPGRDGMAAISRLIDLYLERFPETPASDDFEQQRQAVGVFATSPQAPVGAAPSCGHSSFS